MQSNPVAALVQSHRRRVLIGQTNATLQIFDDHPVPSGVVQGVSLAETNLITTGNNASLSPSISADGRYIAFASYANNLVTTPPNTGGNSEVFLHDRQTGSNTLVSLDFTGMQVANSYSASPQLSGDAQELVFLSEGNNLTTNATPGNQEIFRAQP